MKTCTESMQLEVAVPTPFWELPYKHQNPMATDTWIKETWREAQEFGEMVEDFHATIPKPKEGNINLMLNFNAKHPNATKTMKKNTKWCWVYLQAMFLSNIYTPIGKKLIQE